MTKKISVPRFRGSTNYKSLPQDYETPIGKSETVPGEGRTVRELLEDYTSGIPLPLSQEEFYNPQANFETDTTTRNPDFDLTDVENIVEKQILTEAKAEESKRAKLEEKIDDQKSEESTDKGSSEADEQQKEKLSADES